MMAPTPVARRHALLLLPFAALALLFMAACGLTDYQPEAVGPDAQLTVVIDSARWQGPIGAAVREHLAPYINTLPVPGRMFDVRVRELDTNADLENVKKFKNVVFVAPLSGNSNVAEFLRAQFSEEALQAVGEGPGVVVHRSDLWRENQEVYFVTAATPDALIEALERRGGAVQDTLNRVIRLRMQEDMFERGRQFELEERLLNEHGFAVNVQHDYVIVADTTVGQTGFVLMVRSLPQTWRRVFVWYKENADPATITPEWIYATRDSLAQIYLRGGQCGYAKLDRRQVHDRDYLDTEPINFLGRYGFETRGLWYFAEETPEGPQLCTFGGGPLLNYTFYDERSDRIYMIGGLVFAPDFDKREFIRQIEVIAHTFRSRPEVQGPPGTSDDPA